MQPHLQVQKNYPLHTAFAQSRLARRRSFLHSFERNSSAPLTLGSFRPQGVWLDAPVLLTKFPALACVQLLAPVTALKLPAAHCVCELAPTMLTKFPTLASVHAAAPVTAE